METKTSNVTPMSGIVPRLFPSLGPALLLSMGYIDPGKWATAVEGGARFGFDLLLLVLVFNCTGILCQYLAACIGVVTRKNLAQICSEEYSRSTCILLGFQAEVSVFVSELTMIIGIAHGLNILLGVDLITCVLFTAIDAVLFPLFITFLERRRPEVLLLSVAGFTLLFYVFGVLLSQPEIPLVINGKLPRLRGESAYLLMGLLGANIMPHNFYFHSSIVQQWQRLPNVSRGALCHEHFFAILFIFSGIFLVNYVLMNSAATIFHIGGVVVLTLQESLLMDQVFRSPTAPFTFFLVLFFSSQITALTGNLGGQVVLHNFFGIDSPIWVHRIAIKILAIIPVLYCGWNFGVEGIFQLLIFSQVLNAMLLPSSVIPLFRVASSESIMGTFKISRSVEILALSAFLGMVALKIIFIVELFFGDSDWRSNLTGNMGSSMTLSYIIVLIIACASLVLMLWLAATPLKSASDGSDIQMCDWDLQKGQLESSEDRSEDDINKIRYVGDEEPLAEQNIALEKFVESRSDIPVVEFDLDLPESSLDSSHETQQSVSKENQSTINSTMDTASVDKFSDSSHPEDSAYAAEMMPMTTVDKLSADSLCTLQRTEAKSSAGKTLIVEGDVQTEKDDDEGEVWEPEELSREISMNVTASTNDGPGSFRSLSSKNEDGGNSGSGSGSLSRLCGLGRAARRQLAAILDEFWGQLYDFHGQTTKEAKSKRVDVLLGLDLKPSIKADMAGMDSSTNLFTESERGGSVFLTNPRDYDSPKQQRTMLSTVDSYYGDQMGPSSWSSHMQSSDAYIQSSMLDGSERRYSSLRLPPSSDGRDYQPATIHGYQLASYLSRIATDINSDLLSIPLDSPTPKSTSFVPNYRDSLAYTRVQNGFGALRTSSMQNPTVSRISRLEAERPYYDPCSSIMSESVGSSSVYPKKYHSLPDISGLAVSNRNVSLAGRNSQLNAPIGPRSSVGRMAYDQSIYSNTVSRAEGVPLAFDELSPSMGYRDALSLQMSSNLDTKSLWARQPFEQLFGVAGKGRSGGNDGFTGKPNLVPQAPDFQEGSEAKLLQSFRFCMMKLLKLEGSEWLFRQNGGSDEELIDRVAARERFLYEAEPRELNRLQTGDSHYMSSDRKSMVPHCGEGCIWQVGLIVSFGVWCIHRVLELSLMESRPELWGKYTYVLNRLQGILEPAFSKPRSPFTPCFCLQIPATHNTRSSIPSNGVLPTASKPGKGKCTSVIMLLDIIKDVEIAVSLRKGRSGTAAGDVAFPKGKENLVSVLKRYKRRLLNKPIATHDGGGTSAGSSRKVTMPSSPLSHSST